MTPQQMAHEFFLGIREAMTCPDVSVAEYEGVITYKIEQAIAAEREACIKMIEAAKWNATCNAIEDVAELIAAIRERK